MISLTLTVMDANIFASVSLTFENRHFQVANASSVPETRSWFWGVNELPNNSPTIAKVARTGQIRELIERLAGGNYPAPYSTLPQPLPRDGGRFEVYITPATIRTRRNDDSSTYQTVANLAGTIAGSGAQVEALMQAAYPV